MAKAQYKNCFCVLTPNDKNVNVQDLVKNDIVTLTITINGSVCTASADVIGTGSFGKVCKVKTISEHEGVEQWNWLYNIVIKIVSPKEGEGVKEAVLSKFLGDADVGVPCNASPSFVANDVSSSIFVASDYNKNTNLFIFMDLMDGDLSGLTLGKNDNREWKSVEEQLRKKADDMIRLGVLCTDIKPPNALFKRRKSEIFVYYSDFGTDFCCSVDSKLSSLLENNLDDYSCILEEDEHKREHFKKIMLGMMGSMLRDSDRGVAPILKKEVEYVSRIYEAQFIAEETMRMGIDDERRLREDLREMVQKDASTFKFDVNPYYSPFHYPFDNYSNAIHQESIGRLEYEAAVNYMQILQEYNMNQKDRPARWKGWGHVGASNAVRKLDTTFFDEIFKPMRF